MSHLFDVLAVAGVMLFLAGLWWIYPPLAVLILGASLAILGFGGARLWAMIERGKTQQKTEAD